ncbi:MAG TPA: hypothetical protein VJ904_00990, partial [Tichowtungia sp.]|nr:hypothetical protein [Tichowtungia sp.]
MSNRFFLVAAAVFLSIGCPDGSSASTPPLMSVLSPNSPVSIEVGQSVTFGAAAEASAGIYAIEWYVGSAWESWNRYDSIWVYYQEESFTHTFQNDGTFYVYAYVYDRYSPQREDF